MDKKKLLLLMVALVIAIGTALAAKTLFSGASTPSAEAAQQVPKGPKVLVAQRALPVGTIIKTQEGEVLADLLHDGDRWLGAAGGQGGKGNARFLSNRRSR